MVDAIRLLAVILFVLLLSACNPPKDPHITFFDENGKELNQWWSSKYDLAGCRKVVFDGHEFFTAAQRKADSEELLKPFLTSPWASINVNGKEERIVGCEGFKLRSQKILIVATQHEPALASGVWFFDPKTRNASRGAVIGPVSYFDATRLKDGRILFTGGLGPDKEPVNMSKIYDPELDKITDCGNLAVSRWDHSVVQDGSGRVFVAGGSESDYGAHPGIQLASVEELDLNTRRWKLAGNLRERRCRPMVFSLREGQLLIVGGWVGGMPGDSDDMWLHDWEIFATSQ